MTRIHDLSWPDRLAVAAHLLTRPYPLPVDVADQALAATSDTRRIFDTTARLLPTIDPDTGWTRTEETDPDYVAHVIAAILGCAPCIHLRQEGPQPAIAALALRRLDCRRCVGTRRNPPAGEDDRCDWCGRRGVQMFTSVSVHCGTTLAVGNACPACRASLRIEPDPIDEPTAQLPHEGAHGGGARDPRGGGR